MVATFDERQCYHPNCGYRPETNSACTRVRNSYGICCGPCDIPCYIISSAHYLSVWSDQKTGYQGL